MAPAFAVRPAAAHEMSTVASLFRDYADSLGVDLSYQGFEAELASLPGSYAPPTGVLLLARASNGTSMGCVAPQSTRRLLLVLRRLGYPDSRNAASRRRGTFSFLKADEGDQRGRRGYVSRSGAGPTRGISTFDRPKSINRHRARTFAYRKRVLIAPSNKPMTERAGNPKSAPNSPPGHRLQQPRIPFIHLHPATSALNCLR